jgi:pyridoxine 4-dehydrogenase
VGTATGTKLDARASGTFDLGGRYTVSRLGYGAMRITGDGIWGEPQDPDEAKRVLKRAVELGIDFIDTAHAYGPEVSERLIGETLAPYQGPHGPVVVATKAGLERPGPGVWEPDGRPETLKQECERSLELLKVEAIALFQLHRPDPKVPFAESVGALQELQDEGKIELIGLSNVTDSQLEEARDLVDVVSVQNRYGLFDHANEDVLAACELHGIAFIPWFPLGAGDLVKEERLQAVAKAHEATPAQVALAWLLQRSPVILPIPGTSRVAHLEENVAAAGLELTDAEYASLAA